MSDSAELRYGTDPGRRDTDGDGRIDGREVDVGSPILFDHRPPRIVREYARTRSINTSTRRTYTVDYWIGDPSGLQSVTFTLGDNTLDKDSLQNHPISVDEERKFNVSGFDNVLDSATGTKLRVHATDRHGNKESKVAIRRSSHTGSSAVDIVCNNWTVGSTRHLVIPGTGTAYLDGPCEYHGLTTGAIYVAGAEGKGLIDLAEYLSSPDQYLKPIVGILELLANLGMLDDLKNALGQHYADKHKLNNPYPDGTERYQQYEDGWNKGLVFGYVATIIGPGKLSKAIGGSSKLSKIEEFLTVGHRSQRIIDGAKTGYRSYKLTKQRAIQRTVGVPVSVLKNGGKTGVTVIRTGNLYRKLDADIPKGSRAQVGRFLARHGEEGRRALDALDDADSGAAQRLLDLGTDCTGSNCPDAAEVRQFRTAVVRASEDDRVSGTDLAQTVRGIDSLNSQTRGQAVTFVAETGPEGLRLVRTVDETTLTQITQLATGSQRALVNAWRATGSNIDRHDIEQVLVKSDWASQTDISVHRVRGQQTIISGDVDSDSGTLAVSGRFHGDSGTSVKQTLSSNEKRVEEIFEDKGAGDLYDKHGINSINHLDEIGDNKAYKIRGDLGEEVLQARLMLNKYDTGSFDYDASTDSASLSEGYIPKEDIPYDFGSGQTGFDGLAIDDGNLVVIETKVKSKNGNVVRSDLGNSNNGQQLSENWVEEKFQEIGRDANTAEKRAFLEALEEREIINTMTDGDSVEVVVNHDKIRTEFVEYQDAPVSSNLANADSLRSPNNPNLPTVNRVEIVKIDEAFIIGES